MDAMNTAVSILTEGKGSNPSTIRFFAFDTYVNLSTYGQPESCKDALLQAEKMCRRFEKLLSRTLPNSDVSRINTAAGDAVQVDQITADVIWKALSYCKATDGLFDITIGTLTQLWNMQAMRIPNPETISQALTHVNWRRISVERSNGRTRVRLDDPCASIDLGGFAKGWIADELSAMFDTTAGISGYLIDLGGNIAVGGEKPDGSLWRIGVRNPSPNTGGYPSKEWRKTISLKTGSAVTSGAYERCFMQDGVLYHHIIDPHTGYPAELECMSATVVCKKSVDAEGFSTALLMLGPERSREFITTHPEIIDALFL